MGICGRDGTKKKMSTRTGKENLGKGRRKTPIKRKRREEEEKKTKQIYIMANLASGIFVASPKSPTTAVRSSVSSSR